MKLQLTNFSIFLFRSILILIVKIKEEKSTKYEKSFVTYLTHPVIAIIS